MRLHAADGKINKGYERDDGGSAATGWGVSKHYDAQYAEDRNGDYWDYRRDDNEQGDYRGHSDRYNHWQSDEYDHGQRGYWTRIF